MGEDIHKWTRGRYVLMFDEHTFFVWDNENDERMTALETTERLNEQQDTIFKLQDICGKSDGENMKLRIENKRLQEEIKLLKPTNIEQYEQIVQLQKENEQLKKEHKIAIDEMITDYKKLEKEIKRLKCMNNQLERRLDYSIAYDMGECE